VIPFLEYDRAPETQTPALLVTFNKLRNTLRNMFIVYILHYNYLHITKPQLITVLNRQSLFGYY